ncbi:MAG TPA: glycosyltransferase [Anaerolineae bacterium]|nr:glycosyltransferase [Anaerolineae bacterium]
MPSATSYLPFAICHPPMTLALVHDWLNQYGGAERVLEVLVEMYPSAPLYTSIYWRDGMPPGYRAWDIRTSWLDRAPGIYQHHQPYLPLYPLAFRSFDLGGYDVVISNKSGFCHGVPAGDALHVCYCLAPTRYVWDLDAYVEREALGRAAQVALKPLIAWLRRWDYAAAQRVTHFVAISSEIQGRIRKYYNRDAVVIHPPADLHRYQPAASHDDFYLIVSRLIPYKRIDVAIEAFNRLRRPLWIAGAGRDAERLQSMAGPTITFLGRVPDSDLPDLTARCKAFVFPGHEDFGIAPVEAQAAGRPVIAYGVGGALDSVIDGVSGVLFHEQSAGALMDAVHRLDAIRFDPGAIRDNAARFDAQAFKLKLTAFVDKCVSEWTTNQRSSESATGRSR